MGYYIPNGQPIESAQGVEQIEQPDSIDEIEKAGKAVIVELDNLAFKAYGYAYSNEELREFTHPADARPKRFFTMPLEQARTLSGYRS